MKPRVGELAKKSARKAKHPESAAAVRRQAEEKLRESEERFRLFAESINEVLWMADVETMTTFYVSPGYERIWGRPCATLYERPRSFLDAVHAEDRERVLVELARKKRGLPFDLEYRIIRLDGSCRWIWDRGFPVRGKSGQVSCYVGVARDITVRKHREEECAGLNEQLRALSARLANVQEAERKHLAQELHDRVGQSLTALGLSLSIVRNEFPANAAATTLERVDDSLRLVEQVMADVRDLMGDLRPSVLDDYGLLAALRWYGAQFSHRMDIAVVVRGSEAAGRLPAEAESGLFRIAQEALTNVAKHARAKQVTLSLEEEAGELRLTISDDGAGFDVSACTQPGQRRGWGLLSMRERAAAAGGHLRIDSAPGTGTRVVVAMTR